MAEVVSSANEYEDLLGQWSDLESVSSEWSLRVRGMAERYGYATVDHPV